MMSRLPAVVLLVVVLCGMAAGGARLWGQGANSGAAMTVPLMTVKEIRERNKANEPVMVRGVVTAMDVVRIYVQDETGAIGIIRAAMFAPVAPGDHVTAGGGDCSYRAAAPLGHHDDTGAVPGLAFRPQ